MVPRTALPVAALALVASLAVVPVAGQGSALVTFGKQTSDGLEVVVAEVALPDGGFVAIHDASLEEPDGDAVGSVVGVSRKLDSGTHRDVTAFLFEHRDEDQRLVARPHRDTDGDGAFGFVSGDGEVDGPYTPGGEPVTDGAPVTVSATVAARAQVSEGRHVLVDRVSVEDGGFVVLRSAGGSGGNATTDDDSGNATDGNTTTESVATEDTLTGVSSHLEPGVHQDVRVRLDGNLTGDRTFNVTLHRDGNGNETLDVGGPGPVEDPAYANHTGAAVSTTVDVALDGNASVALPDQATGGHVVDVRRVHVPERGFVTVHDASLAGGGSQESFRGVSTYLGPGLHEDVEVPLSEPLEEEGVVYAAAHRDSDGDQRFDYLTSDGADDGPYTDDDGATVADAGEAHLSASVSYDRRSSPGSAVTAHRVDLSAPGFVAVHDAGYRDGEVLGSVVGVSSKLEPGLQRDLRIPLDEPVRDSQTLTLVPYRDANGNGTYDFVSSLGGDDEPFRVPDGSPVADAAFTEVRASVVVEDQATDGTRVTVEAATLPDGGFVTVHDESLLQGEAVESLLGTSEYRPPGTTRNLTVALDDNITEDQALYVVPHRDTNRNAGFDFVLSEAEEDVPYVAAGGPVAEPLEATLGPGDTTDEGPSRPWPEPASEERGEPGSDDTQGYDGGQEYDGEGYGGQDYAGGQGYDGQGYGDGDAGRGEGPPGEDDGGFLGIPDIPGLPTVPGPGAGAAVAVLGLAALAARSKGG